MDGNADFSDVYTVSTFDATTYSKDSWSGADIHNLFDNEAGTVTYLTRSDWEGTFPEHDGTVSSFPSTWGNEVNGTDGGSYIYVKTATAEEIAKLDSTDSLNPTPDSSFTQAPTYGAKNGLTLIDMRGLSYDDAKWDQLLDQLTAEDTSITGTGGINTLPFCCRQLWLFSVSEPNGR